MTDDDLTAIFAPTSRSSVRIGTLYHDVRQPAFVQVNELLRQHFAVLGTTGSGKIVRGQPVVGRHSG